MVTFPTITQDQKLSQMMRLPRYRLLQRRLDWTSKTPGGLPYGKLVSFAHQRPYSVRKDSDTSFVILVASADKKPAEKHIGAFDNTEITIEYGDHSEALQKVVAALSEAKKYAGMLSVRTSELH
jgi:hypothetical protein